MSVTPRIQLSEVNGTQVVRFRERQLFDERTVREVADQILAALPNDGGPIRLVLDFTDINLVSSTLLQQAPSSSSTGWRPPAASYGSANCRHSPSQQVFRTARSRLRLFSIDRDQRTALDSFQ